MRRLQPSWRILACLGLGACAVYDEQYLAAERRL